MTANLIHIGYPRTGTTWMQTQVFPHVQNYLFLDRKIVQHHIIHPSCREFDAQQFIDTIPSYPVLISEEMILGRFQGGEINLIFLKEMLQRLVRIFNNFGVILVIRRQQDLIYSLYHQYLRKGGTYSIRRFLDEKPPYKTSLLFGKDFLCYDQVIKILMEYIPREAIHIYLYEELFREGPEFIRRFAEELTLSIDTKEIIFRSENAGYPQGLVPIKRFLNHLSKRGTPFKENYLHLPFTYDFLRKTGRKKKNTSNTTQKILNDFCSHYKESNAKLQHLTGLDKISEFGYALP